jgi:hypothetical protein
MRPGELWLISQRAWLFLFLSGLTTGFSWLCYFRALKLGAVSKVAPIDKLSIVVAMGLSLGVLGESLTIREACGAGGILLGALLLAWHSPPIAVTVYGIAIRKRRRSQDSNAACERSESISPPYEIIHAHRRHTRTALSPLAQRPAWLFAPGRLTGAGSGMGDDPRVPALPFRRANRPDDLQRKLRARGGKGRQRL